VTSSAVPRRVVVESSNGWRALDLAELWRYRELLLFLAWRDIRLRYKQTALGVAWALLQPLLAMAVFAVVFGLLAGMPSDGVPYPLFALVGLLPWLYFANAVSATSGSLVNNANLVSKVYFPRLIVPLATTLPPLVDLVAGIVLMILALVALGRPPGGNVVLFPFFVLLAVGAATSVGVWLSAISVRYRDVRYTVPFLLQIWMFATPVVYPARLVPEQFRTLYGLNPMVSVIEGFRWSLLGTAEAPGAMLAVSAATVFLLLVTGLLYFRRLERSFADVI
jgi:lipopolysaccharide transport system permease protein